MGAAVRRTETGSMAKTYQMKLRGIAVIRA